MSEKYSVVDEDKKEIEVEITSIKILAEFDAWMMISILEQGKVEGADWYWLSNKLELLLDGKPPAEVFPRIGREVQKNKKTERDIVLTKMYVEMRRKKFRKAIILQALAEAQNVSESVVESAWKKWGKFFPES